MTGKLTFLNNIRFTEDMTSFFLADFKARWVAGPRGEANGRMGPDTVTQAYVGKINRKWREQGTLQKEAVPVGRSSPNSHMIP
jgi:hypothetical protein